MDDVLIFAAILEREARLAIDPRVVNVAGLPADRAEACLYAEPLAAKVAMRFSCRIILLHGASPIFVAEVGGSRL
jgi:hypothetical protein